MPAFKKRKTMTVTKELSSLKRKVRALETSAEKKAKSFTWDIGQSFINNPVVNKEYPRTGNVKVINALVQGTAGEEGDRIGNQVTNKSMWIRHKETIAGQSVSYRTAIVWDKQPNGSAPFYEQIFFDDAASSSDLVYAGINLEYRERFQVLYDNINSMHKNAKMQLSVALPGGAEIVRDLGEAYIDLKNKTSTYSESSGVPQTGALLLVTIAQNTLLDTASSSVSTVQPDVIAQGVIRLRYTDS